MPPNSSPQPTRQQERMNTPLEIIQLHEQVERSIVEESRSPAVGESSPDAAKTTKARMDSPGPLVAGAPSKKFEEIERMWRYHSLNSAKMRRQRLEELEGRLEGKLEERMSVASASAPGCASKYIELAPSSRLDTPSTIGFLSINTLESSHPFAGKTKSERKRYFDNLPIWGASSSTSSIGGRLSRSMARKRSNSMSVATLSSIVEDPIEEGRTQVELSPLTSTSSDQTAVSSELSLASTQPSNMQLSTSTPQSSTSQPSTPENQRPLSEVGSSMLRTICCRSGAVTPSLMPHVISRLPVRAGASLPRRFKLRPGWGKKDRALTTDAESSSLAASPHFTFNSRLPTLSFRSCTPSSGTLSSPLLNPAALSSMIRRAPNSITSAPSFPEIPTPSPPPPMPPLPTQSSIFIQAPTPIKPTLHAMLRVTTLSDLPLRSPTDVQHIQTLLLDVARDRENPHTTWPRVKQLQEQDEGDAPLQVILGESHAQTVQRVKVRLKRVDEGARRGVLEGWERERGVASINSSEGSGSRSDSGKRVRWADEMGQGSVSEQFATAIETEYLAGVKMDGECGVELENEVQMPGEEESEDDAHTTIETEQLAGAELKDEWGVKQKNEAYMASHDEMTDDEKFEDANEHWLFPSSQQNVGRMGYFKGNDGKRRTYIGV